ncbi:MAG: YajD family HNH nuclease, partial [Syntrophales bacterium LBB04]|nr:YajD family HNH nuclease [Syntrophales bacterium LBB04]
MAKVSYGSRSGQIRKTITSDKTKTLKSPEEVVRELKQLKPSEGDYREKALAIYGLICAHCGREFESSNRQLLTIHHRDGNHYYNPPDGSNWRALCAFCHEDVHS